MFDYLLEEELEMFLFGKLKVGNLLLVILGNFGRELLLIFVDLIGSLEGFLDSIFVYIFVNRIFILFIINILN